jgi:hypothetical protein
VSWRAAWPDGVGHRWLDALRIPALSWVRPLVGELGLPPAIAERPESLAAIAQAAAPARAVAARRRHRSPLRGPRRRHDARDVQLADEYSREDAESFERCLPQLSTCVPADARSGRAAGVPTRSLTGSCSGANQELCVSRANRLHA